MQRLEAKAILPRITVSGEKEITYYLCKATGLIFDPFHLFLDIGTEINNPVQVTASGKNVDNQSVPLTGKMTKRIRKYMKWVNHIELSEKDLARIGNIIDNNTMPTSDLFIRITETPYKDWHGQFGDRGSCFYRDFEGMLYGWEVDQDAFGIEFYDSEEKPYGRLLGCYGNGDYEIVTNGYTVRGRSSATEHLAQVYASFLAKNNSRISMGRDYETHPHLNTGEFFIIGEEADEYVSGDWSMDLVTEYPTESCNCGGHAIMKNFEYGVCGSCNEILSWLGN